MPPFDTTSDIICLRGHLDRVQHGDSKVVRRLERDSLIAHLKQANLGLATLLNKYTSKHNVRNPRTGEVFKFNVDLNFSNVGAAYLDAFNDACVKEGKPGGRGFVNYDDNVETAVLIIKALLEGDKHIGLNAPTQSGKTSVQVLVALLWRLICTVMDVHVEVFAVPYHRLVPMDVMLSTYNNCRNIYPNIKIVGHDNLSLSAAASQLYSRDHDIFAKRNTHKEVEKVEARARNNGAFTKRGDHALVIIDEADYASASKGESNPIAHFLDNPNYRCLLVSATTAEFEQLSDRVEMIQMQKDEKSGYRHICLGRPIPVTSLSILAARLGVKKLVASDDRDGFQVKKNGVSFVGDVAQLMAKLVSGFPAHDLGLFGARLNGGRGMVVRFGDVEAEALAAKFETTYAKKLGVRVVRYWSGAATKDENGRPQTIEQAMGSDDCVIFLKGAGRRADEFPASCTIFLDFTRQYDCKESFTQGMVGRISGYKPTHLFLMVSDENMRIVEATREFFEHTGIFDPQLKSRRAVLVEGKVHRSHEKDRYVINLTHADPAIRKVAEQLTKYLLPITRVKEENRRSRVTKVESKIPVVRLSHYKESEFDRALKKVVRPAANDGRRAAGLECAIDYVAVLGGAKNVAALEAFISQAMRSPVRLLMPGENGPRGRSFESTDELKFVRFNVGNANRSGHQGGGDGVQSHAERVAQRGSSNKGARALRPEVLFHISGPSRKGTYKPVAPASMLLWLTSAVKNCAGISDIKQRYLPDTDPAKGSIYAILANDTQITEVNTHKAKRSRRRG